MNVVRRAFGAGDAPAPGSTQCSSRPSKHTSLLVRGRASHPLLAREF
jgi:hypothetical protein